ncbi:hypothetical protein FZX02_02825 [Synechococcus sp. MU1644]|nr:hypothetical protein [Synechococcus sp. MU1644]
MQELVSFRSIALASRGGHVDLCQRDATCVVVAGLWEELQTDWVLLDAELMPWSAKAQELLKRQYLPTVAAANSSASALLVAISKAGEIEGLEALHNRTETQFPNAQNSWNKQSMGTAGQRTILKTIV